MVTLRRADGKRIEVPLAKLSKENQNNVLARRQPKGDPIAALEKTGARVQRNEQGEVVGVRLIQAVPATARRVAHPPRSD
ncbi:MAG: hypothetical protein CMJ81_20715 [Planctomycetaceae bacterium]|nr:hypothetical protein [Planctomycetaceae bacterium]